jgi:hypothetical protein
MTINDRLLSWVHGPASERAHHEGILRDVWQEADGTLWAWDDLDGGLMGSSPRRAARTDRRTPTGLRALLLELPTERFERGAQL